MDFDLVNACKGKTLVAAHRGAAGANIPCNTICSFETALFHGADMIELDISRSADGTLYVFHPGTEPVFLKSQKYIKDMTSGEVDAMYLVNQDDTPTQYRVSRFDEILERFKGRCYINIDKFWMWPAEIAQKVRDHGMQDQVLIKNYPGEEAFRCVEEVASDLPYMLILREQDDYSEALKKRKMRYVGVEALFTTDDAPICSDEYIACMHDMGLMLWGNAIVYDYRAVLSAGHTDDISASGNPDAGWGWLANKGFDIIQTDWIMPCVKYLESIGKR